MHTNKLYVFFVMINLSFAFYFVVMNEAQWIYDVFLVRHIIFELTYIIDADDP